MGGGREEGLKKEEHTGKGVLNVCKVGQYQAYPAGPPKDVRVIRIVIPLTGHLDAAKLVGRVHFCLALPLNRRTYRYKNH